MSILRNISKKSANAGHDCICVTQKQKMFQENKNDLSAYPDISYKNYKIQYKQEYFSNINLYLYFDEDFSKDIDIGIQKQMYRFTYI